MDWNGLLQMSRESSQSTEQRSGRRCSQTKRHAPRSGDQNCKNWNVLPERCLFQEAHFFFAAKSVIVAQLGRKEDVLVTLLGSGFPLFFFPSGLPHLPIDMLQCCFCGSKGATMQDFELLWFVEQFEL